MNTIKTVLKKLLFESKDLVTITLFSLIGLAGFVLYLSYFTTVMFGVAIAYLTFSLAKHVLTKKNNDKALASHI